MLIQLVVFTIILGSAVAAPPPPPTPPTTTPSPRTTTSHWNFTTEGHESLNSLLKAKDVADRERKEAATMTYFRFAFMAYEKRVKTFLENIKIKEYPSKNVDSETFLDELRTYVDFLPKNETREVTIRFRERCHCDGANRTPCPEKCMYSCYAFKRNIGRSYWKDCNAIKNEISGCYCNDGSSPRCDGALNKCYEEKTELEQVNTTCSQYIVDPKLPENTYLRLVDMLVEPLRKQVRGLEYQFSSFKQSVIATDLLFNFTYSSCEEQNETPCFPEASHILSRKLTAFFQLKRNITMDMIRLQETVEAVSHNLTELKEQTLSQIQAMTKSYSCCIKGLDFSVKDNACKGKIGFYDGISTFPHTGNPRRELPLLHSQLKKGSCRDSSFQCDNQLCVPESYRCDGANDCGDMSDEVNC